MSGPDANGAETNGIATRLFAEAELRAERTAAGLRVVVGLLLIGTFVVAVLLPARPTDEVLSRQIGIAVVVQGLYLALGLLGLLVTRAPLFRSWMPWFFVTCDVAFIVGNVAQNLGNIGMPANHVAGLPVIWLVPMILAFIALRYDTRLMIFGAVLFIVSVVVVSLVAGGWVDPDTATPPGFLFDAPPNIMRLVMIGLATIVLHAAIARSRADLLRAIDETRRRTNLTRYLPLEIADHLANAGVDKARRGRRQRAAVLFVDIRGFTERAEALDTRAVGRLLGEFRRRMSAAATAYGGVIDKFIGDAVMVVFGLPEPGSTDAANALACGREMLAEMARWNRVRTAEGEDEIAIGIGIHWGEVYCGAIGDEQRLEFTVLGDTVNVAARIEEQTKGAGLPLVVSGDVLDAAGEDAEDWAVLGGQNRLRGRKQDIALYGFGPA